MATKRSVNGAKPAAEKSVAKPVAKSAGKPAATMSIKTLMYPLIGAVVIIIAVFIMMQPAKLPVTDGSGQNQTVTQGSITDEFARCARLANIDPQYGFIKKLVSDFYNGTKRTTFVYGMPKTLNCTLPNGTWYDLPYSLEIGDGYIKTTLGGQMSSANFTKGIVVQAVSIPADDMAKGVYLYIQRPQQGNLGYGYEVINESALKFDDYDPKLAKSLDIIVVPSLVFNCKQVYIQRTDMPEIRVRNAATGQFEPVLSEEALLRTLLCAFNNGKPESACSQLDLVNSEGKISLPPEVALRVYQTTQDSCRPDNETIDLKAFYTVDCPACEEQRKIVDDLAAEFGESMDLTYYCMGSSSECSKFIKAGAI